MGIVILILVVILIMVYQGMPLLKQGLWREFFVFSGLLVIGIILTLIQILNIEAFNPTGLVEAVFRPVTELLYKLLGFQLP